MKMRIGKVTNIYPSTGKIKVMYEDAKNASLPLAMLTMNQEYSMPSVGDRVVTMHMENGSSKGFVLGTYYGGGMQPKANSGYRKDFGPGAYAACKSGQYRLSAKEIALMGNGQSSLALKDSASLIGREVMVGCAAGSEDKGEPEPEVYLKLTEEEMELGALSKLNLLCETGGIGLVSVGSDAHLLIDTESEIKAERLSIATEDLTLKCSYGEETLENILRRIERIEDHMGLPHTI